MKNKFNQSYTAIKAGDLIISEKPFAFVLSSKENGLRCDNCLNRYVFYSGLNWLILIKEKFF